MFCEKDGRRVSNQIMTCIKREGYYYYIEWKIFLTNMETTSIHYKVGTTKVLLPGPARTSFAMELS